MTSPAELDPPYCPGCRGPWPGAAYICNHCGWRPGELVVHGLSVGHGCSNCSQLRIIPEAIHTNGPHYELVASITAGHGDTGDGDGGRASVGILIDDIPAVIAELQKIHDRAALAEAEQRIPSEWPVYD